MANIEARIDNLEKRTGLNNEGGLEEFNEMTLADFLSDDEEAYKRLDDLVAKYGESELIRRCKAFERRTGKKSWVELMLDITDDK
jgi:hypothetical protein